MNTCKWRKTLSNIELNVLDVQFAQQCLHPIDTDGNSCISFLIMPGIAELGSLDELKWISAIHFGKTFSDRNSSISGQMRLGLVQSNEMS